MNKVYIILENGRVFEGNSFGAVGKTVGELVFNTSVVGYLEALTDPCYAGQIIMYTYPQVGNYGIIPENFKSQKCHAKGVVVREWCNTPSNFRSQGDLGSFLKEQGVVGICGVDTRELTHIIRKEGVMNAMITPIKPGGVPVAVKNYKIEGVVAETSCKRHHVVEPKENAKYNVALIDFGSTQNIINELHQRGCRVFVFPYDVKAEDILTVNPDGIILSDGAGDPAENIDCAEEIKKILGRKPTLGIGLGHQLMALSFGGKTEKMRQGHRGENQPVRELESNRVYITSQNHGYSVIPGSIGKSAGVESYVNLNDGSCEGMIYPMFNAFSLQFYPDTHTECGKIKFAFDKFLQLMEGGSL